MKKFLVVLTLLFGSSFAAYAQGDISYPVSDPTGNVCTTTFALYQGKLFSCVAGHYALLPTNPVGNPNFVLYPSSSPNGNACTVPSTNVDPLAQVFAGTVYTCQGGFYTAVAGGGGGGVSSVSVTSPFVPLFTTTVATPTTTPHITFTLSSAAAHTFFGNNTGISGTPAYAQPACGDLSNAAASCSTDATNATNISSGTINNLRLPSTISISGTMTASSFSGTGNAFSGTEAATSSIACASTLDILWADSGAHRWKMCNNNGTADTVAGLADIANQVTAASAATAAKQTCVASGANKTCSYISFPDAKIVPFASAPGGTAVSGVTYASGQWTPTLRAGTNNIGAALQAIPSTGASLQFVFELPGDWDTTQQPFISIYYGSGANTTGTVIWTVSSACSKADGSVTDDPTFVAETAFASQTMAAANRYWAKSGQYTAITSGNSCIPGSPVLIKVALSGTASSAINADKAVITVPRLLTVQAN